jgi:DNA uptake protein ComE-like DNA-binding protein
MTFPGIDPDRARKIIDAREKLGFFRSLDEAKKSGFDPGQGL